MKTNTLAIVGGGTAGLLTALILKQTYPKLKIDIIESDKIGIVGVGEGSTEHWQSFMGHCNISTSELVEKTDATFKYGINFQNWNGDGDYYIQSVSGGFNIESQTRSKMIYSYLIAKGATPQQLTHDYIDKGLHTTPYWSINQFHFNTMKLNTFLHDLCEKRDIGIIKAEIDQVNLNDHGEIDNLVSAEGVKFQYDFYVDSTGFHKLIVHKAMGVPWKSWQEYLPMIVLSHFLLKEQKKLTVGLLLKRCQLVGYGEYQHRIVGVMAMYSTTSF
jgi:tryptophan 7-halogenase